MIVDTKNDVLRVWIKGSVDFGASSDVLGVWVGRSKSLACIEKKIGRRIVLKENFLRSPSFRPESFGATASFHLQKSAGYPHNEPVIMGI